MKINIKNTTSKILNTPEKRDLFIKLKQSLEIEVCKILDVDYEKYLKHYKRRKRPYIEIQHIVRNVLYNAGLTLIEITYFFNCDHTSVINSNQVINDLLDVDIKAKSFKIKLLNSFKFRRIFIEIRNNIKPRTKHFVISKLIGNYKMYISKDGFKLINNINKAAVFKTENEAQEIININSINKATILPIYNYE